MELFNKDKLIMTLTDTERAILLNQYLIMAELSKLKDSSKHKTSIGKFESRLSVSIDDNNTDDLYKVAYILENNLECEYSSNLLHHVEEKKVVNTTLRKDVLDILRVYDDIQSSMDRLKINIADMAGSEFLGYDWDTPEYSYIQFLMIEDKKFKPLLSRKENIRAMDNELYRGIPHTEMYNRMFIAWSKLRNPNKGKGFLTREDIEKIIAAKENHS